MMDIGLEIDSLLEDGGDLVLEKGTVTPSTQMNRISILLFLYWCASETLDEELPSRLSAQKP